ncbi:MAG: response regulator transcription factor [Paludibacter sp.]|jgi:two-component system phosphate regulon response regulator PhoB
MDLYRILVVDDEEDLCEILQFNLENEGYSVDVAYSAEQALKKDLLIYNLLLLDVMMAGISGFKMARIIRDNPRTANIPIIFLTAKISENDRLTGFTIGADDYISKPFSIREVMARINAVIRRVESSKKTNKDEIIRYDKLEMNSVNKKVLLEKKEVFLTKKEFELLKLFLENRNRVFSRDEILNRVWSDEDSVLNRTIDVNITRLRKKIGIYERNIVTRLGYGYCFEE